MRECASVAHHRVVLFTWDPLADGLWLLRDYFPVLLQRDRARFPSMASIEKVLGPLEVHVVPIPADCLDGFSGAYWRRPAAYLDPRVRAGISVFAEDDGDLQPLDQLRADLASGAWAKRYASLNSTEALDLGYRVVVAHVG